MINLWGFNDDGQMSKSYSFVDLWTGIRYSYSGPELRLTPLHIMGCLDDVVALVVSRPLGPVNTKQVLTERLQSLGAKIAGRLSKEVTHIIFQRQRFADADEHSAEDSDLRALYDRTAKVREWLPDVVCSLTVPTHMLSTSLSASAMKANALQEISNHSLQSNIAFCFKSVCGDLEHALL